MNFINKNKITIIGAAFGAVVGFLYYKFIVCSSGTCAITTKPVNSTLYGALMGSLLFNLLQSKKIKC